MNTELKVEEKVEEKEEEKEELIACGSKDYPFFMSKDLVEFIDNANKEFEKIFLDWKNK
ncbi:hypothetical protein [Clostridium sp.]|uniref:hypothetical protein n=1 Tax=Clostridium sp. TaxID=1506 RepID=UPI003993F4F8